MNPPLRGKTTATESIRKGICTILVGQDCVLSCLIVSQITPRNQAKQQEEKPKQPKQHLSCLWGIYDEGKKRQSSTTNSACLAQLFLKLQPHGNSSAAIHQFTTMWIFNTAAGVFHVMWMEPSVLSHLRYRDRLLSYIVTQPAQWKGRGVDASEKRARVTTFPTGVTHKNTELKTSIFITPFHTIRQYHASINSNPKVWYLWYTIENTVCEQ